MVKHTIEVDKKTCIGCGACVAVCSKYFEMKETDEGMKAVTLKTETTDDFDSVKEAADVCPVNAIHMTDDEGKKII